MCPIRNTNENNEPLMLSMLLAFVKHKNYQHRIMLSIPENLRKTIGLFLCLVFHIRNREDYSFVENLGILMQGKSNAFN